MSEGTSSNIVVVDCGDGVGSSRLRVGEGGCGAGTGSMKGGDCNGWRSTNLRSDSSYASRSTAVRVWYMGQKTRLRVTLFGWSESIWWWNPWLCRRSMVLSIVAAMWRVEEITWSV